MPRFLRTAKRIRAHDRIAASRRPSRQTISARRDLGRRGRKLRALLGERREGRTLPLRPARAARGRADRAARVYRFDLARLPARRSPGFALRLSRVRTVRSSQRPPLQPPQAAARSVRGDGDRRRGVERRPLRVSRRLAAGRSLVRPARQRRRDAEMRRRRYGVHVGQRSSAAHALARPRHLRNARARLYDEASRRRTGTPRNDGRTLVAGGHRVSDAPRRQRDRTAAGAEFRRRPQSHRKRSAQLLGLQPALIFRAGAALSLARRSRRVQDDGQAHARSGHRSDSRRRLQSHRRGQANSGRR